MLPSSPRLLLYGGLVSLVLALLSRGLAGAISFVLAYLAFIFSAVAISAALRITDEKTIANFRRASALVLASGILWLVLVAIGATYAWATGSPNALTNVYLYGAFVCAGLEYLIINGAFVRSNTLSLALAIVYPVSSLLILRFTELAGHFDPIAFASGVVSLTTIIAFPFLLKRMKTSLGHDAVSLFQAFMKTWTARYPDELEGIIADHSETVQVSTKVLRFRTKIGDTFLVLPGVHPGPFHPIGSYDLPRVVSRAFSGIGPAMTLHRPGGHERNLATRADTLKYAAWVKELALSIDPPEGKALLQGPVHAQVGKATVSASSFSKDMILTISFAPLGSDDLDTQLETIFAKRASDIGFDLSVVDAHNSIDDDLESPEMDDPGWERIFEATRKINPEPFEVAYAHSREVGFVGGGDLTENGIALFMVRSGETKSTLFLADANNAVPALRGEVARALDSAGYKLIEFCTSDSHNLAARGLTVERGYEALGEATPPASIADLAVKLAKLAESKLAPAEYGSAEQRSEVRVFGAKALGEFAAITQSSSRFSQNYFRFAVLATAVLLVVSIVF